MEQQKLLWTILSVGILVLIILGAGMFFFLPSDSTGLAQNGKTTEWSKATAQAPAPEQKAPEVKKTPTQPASPAPAPKPEIKKTPVQTTPSPAPAPKPVPTPKPEVKKTPVQPATPAPAPKATPAPQTKPAPAPKATPAPQTKPAQTQAAAAKPAQGSYWVQVGSYATMDAADKIKKELAAKGYTSSIQSITANGKTYHRVKIGPYADRADVNSLLPKIKALPGMGDSFITTK